MLKFIFSKVFLIQLCLALLVAAIAIGGAYMYLLNYTRQEAIVEVPSLNGYDLFEAEVLLKEMSLEGMVVDSLYLPEKRGGEIVDQDPTANASVKENRKIYLTIARYSAPMVRIPDILDQTLPLAMAKLESYDIKVKELVSRPSDCTDCVIGITYNGKKIDPGTTLEKGQAISLIIGEGATGERISIPTLFGLGIDEARELLLMNGLNIGATPFVNCETQADSSEAKVYKQVPMPNSNQKITRGSSIDVYFTSDHTQVPPVNIDSVKSQLN